MEKMIFLNVGWMSSYSGPGQITGGGKYVATHGWGHEMLNFEPFAGKMYGTATTPQYGKIRLEKLGATKKAEFVDGVLVVWVAKSCIVGWYRNARVYRQQQPPPKNSNRSYKGDPISYRVTALESDWTCLDPDNRHFPVPRAQERKHAMGRYIWYAEGASNRAFRAKVLKYVAASGDISALGRGKQSKTGRGVHQPDLQKRAEIEQAAIDLATKHFEKCGYTIKSVEDDNLGWDLNAIRREAGLMLRIEVKGLSGNEISVELTPNEYRMMKKHKRTYRICVATNCLKKSEIRLAVFAYYDKSGSWLDGNDQPLKISEVKSARLHY